MAKTEKPDEGMSDSDFKKCAPFIKKVEKVQEKIDKIMAAAKEECAPHREDIKQIKKDAHDATNIPAEVLNSKLQERRLKAKTAAVRQKLSDNRRETFDQLSFALGEADEDEVGVTKPKPAETAAPLH